MSCAQARPATRCYDRQYLRVICMMPLLVLTADDPTTEARKEIIAAYQRGLDALQRGDADGAMQIDTDDGVSITAGQKPRKREELERFLRRNIASALFPHGRVAARRT